MAPQNARQGSRRRLAQHRARRRTRKRLEPLGHHGHAEQEQPTPPRIEIVVDMNPLMLAPVGAGEPRGDNSRRLGRPASLVAYQPNLVTLRTDLVKRGQERCRIP